MKKLFTFAVALLMVFALAVPAYAIVYDRDTVLRQKDELGNDVKIVIGTIAFDSGYECDVVTGGSGRCGEVLTPSQIGMTTITHMFIEGAHVDNASTFFVFDYDAAYLVDTGATGGIRANYSSDKTGGVAGVSVPSVPTYDLSGLTAVPFMAIGT